MNHLVVFRREKTVDAIKLLMHIADKTGIFFNHLADFLRCLRGGGGKTSDFFRDYRKPTSRFARACGLNGGVQRQNIGLSGNVVNRGDNLFDVFGRIIQFVTDLRSGCYLRGHGFCISHRLAQNLIGIRGEMRRFFRCIHGNIRNLLRRDDTLGDIRSQLNHFINVPRSIFNRVVVGLKPDTFS